MTTPAEPQGLEERIAFLQSEVNRLNAEKNTGVKATLKRIGAGILAALTSPDAIKAEKSLVALALTRAAILVPAAAVLIDILVKALGGPAVGAP